MELVKKYKNILIGVGVLVAVFGIYAYWPVSDTPSDGTSTLSYDDTGAVDTAFVGQEILGILNRLRDLKIDGSVFDNPVFKSLVDYRVATTSEPIGRSDPFAPLPGLPTP